MNMPRDQLGWVAGIVEGEGCIGAYDRYSPAVDHTYTHALVKVAMADEDIVRRLAEWTGIGRVTGPHLPPSRAKAGHKPQWFWNVNTHAHVEALCAALWPYLGARRREQVSVMRTRMTNRSVKRKT